MEISLENLYVDIGVYWTTTLSLTVCTSLILFTTMYLYIRSQVNTSLRRTLRANLKRVYLAGESSLLTELVDRLSWNISV